MGNIVKVITEESAKTLEWKKCRNKPLEREYAEVTEETWIKTREGTIKAYPKLDYLMKGVGGEIYPIKKDLFRKTYDTTE